MFKKTRSRIKSAFGLFITTVQQLSAALDSNTAALETNSIKAEALAAEQKLLGDKLDTLIEHSRYMAHTKRQELQRSGHKTD